MRPSNHVGEGATAFFLGCFTAPSTVCAVPDCKGRGSKVAAIIVVGDLLTIPLCADHEPGLRAWFTAFARQYVPDRLLTEDNHVHDLRGRSRMKWGGYAA